MSRPAGIRSNRSPFVKPAKRWPEGKKVGIADRVLDEENGTYRNLQLEIREELESYHQLNAELRRAQAARKPSKIQKLRREISKSIELQLYLQNLAWCTGCRSSSGNCHCDDPDYVAPVRESIVFPKQEVKVRKIKELSSSGHELL